MRTPASDTRPQFFADSKRTAEVNREIAIIIREAIQRLRRERMARENELGYLHGDAYSSISTSDPEYSAFFAHQAEYTTPFERVRHHDLDSLLNFINSLTNEMHRQFLQTMYETLRQSTQKSGNLVNSKDHPDPADAFLAALEKIELSVGRDGKVSLPEFHSGSEAYEKMMTALKAKGPQFEAAVEALIAQKTQAALDREEKRLVKYGTT